MRLAGSTSAQMSLGKASQAVCDELANITGETTNVAILDRDQIINVVESIGPAEVTLRTWVGQRCPAHATSSGKILLSSLSALELQKLLPKTLAAFTPHTVCDRQLLERELDTSRRTGWASVHEELEVGLNAVAAPIVDHNGTTIAALSVSGPAYRLQPGSFDQVAEKTVEAAVRISRRLGFGG
ncbi:regulatory proteins IclR [Mycobacteroides abscessus subsp. massiliense]|nr:regulatory proteins IclR [Mycobacteroides abscessus subsp. massiliense]